MTVLPGSKNLGLEWHLAPSPLSPGEVCVHTVCALIHAHTHRYLYTYVHMYVLESSPCVRAMPVFSQPRG